MFVPMHYSAIRRNRSWRGVTSVPGPVRNLRVTGSDPKEPSVTLAWDPPLGRCDITSYEVHFQSCSGGSGDACMTGVYSHTTSICITKGMGLKPLRLCVFKVRALKGQVSGEWSEVSKFVGRYEVLRLCSLPPIPGPMCSLVPRLHSEKLKRGLATFNSLPCPRGIQSVTQSDANVYTGGVRC